MKFVCKENFSEWLRRQIRLSGEELIRRSESLNLGGLDALQDMSIHIRIPTYQEELEASDIRFEFQVLNKKTVDDLICGFSSGENGDES